ncbi:adenylyl-sulfate kinase [Archangium sp.]|uniref:adenylyl-sulfate kinase n=1 Tax=Archangium sp. TaxID=1872627 RepID=UPI002D52C9D2|nr:adenylyl-sulfate kinase [Archangium sp.]HYO60150.1 adenylyl-sulfate kinase [Archangium sp.]
MNPSAVVWFTGLPSSGKSALATQVRRRLNDLGVQTLLLDGDEVRACVKPPAGYDDTGRANAYETLARLAALFAGQRLVVLVPATAHLRSFREQARRLAPRFIEVFLDVPAEEARRRDAGKQLYSRVEKSGASSLPGSGVPYEVPLEPEVIARGAEDTQAVERVVSLLLARDQELVRHAYVGLAIRPERDVLDAQLRTCERYGLIQRRELHVTLAYLGILPASTVLRVADTLSRGLRSRVPERLPVTGVGGAVEFDRTARVNRTLQSPPPASSGQRWVSWWAIKGTSELLALREEILHLLRDIGVVIPMLPFYPHATLGSFGEPNPDGTPWDAYDVAKENTFADDFPEALSVDRLHITDPQTHPSSLEFLREPGVPAWPGHRTST